MVINCFHHPVSIVKLPLECNRQKQSQDKLLVRKLSSPLNGSEVTTYQLWAFTLPPSADSTNWGHIGDCCHAIAAQINHDFIWFMTLLRWFHFYLLVPDAPEYDNVAYHTETNSITLSWLVKCKNGIIQEYRIEYFIVDDSSESKTLSTRVNKIQIGSLPARKTLQFQVNLIYSVPS